MDCKRFILPYPYEAYQSFLRKRERFDEYKEKIYGWVKKNTSPNIITSSYLDKVFNNIKCTEENNKVKNWMISHMDKLRYISDFSGLEFGIEVYDESKCITIRFPVIIDEIDKDLYPNYNEFIFKSMDTINKLEWMYENCEFIPFRTLPKFYCDFIYPEDDWEEELI